MAENFIVIGNSKEEKYQSLIPQLEALVKGETDLVANLANITSAIKTTLNYYWIGFYLVKEGELVLGPFQGTVACTRIKRGRGVCGTAWERNEVIIVDDVDKFPGHIACSSFSKSEIVLPLNDSSGNVIAVLDVDDDKYATFDQIDKIYLSQICILASTLF